ncbi:hypothetical protein M3P21_04035 [Ruegeria sp. 2012CJ41-6]|uniref:DUF3313 domain-containing protein n=1 Tax=Ruegeria spongiae TaxID=2942209 RepID=A0ABT0PZT4_9RHOB|nr:hypothetical protein [Ruegeria spongiae]MCL6282692.1 hypothetical protein [Ruegeria spongiae]
MFRFIVIVTTVAISACSPEMQYTSGRAYLAATGFDGSAVARHAAYEPNLKFPARVGVVRLVYGEVTTMPDKERRLYAEGLPDALGKLVHLGPLEAQLAKLQRFARLDQAGIRQLAASRHLSYVLVLSFDPGKNTAEALFLDVGTGYPYASIETDVPGRGRTNFWGGRLRNQNRLDRATHELARNLKPKLEALAAALIDEAEVD